MQRGLICFVVGKNIVSLVGCWSVVEESLVLCFLVFVFFFFKKKGEKIFCFKIIKKKKKTQVEAAPGCLANVAPQGPSPTLVGSVFLFYFILFIFFF